MRKPKESLFTYSRTFCMAFGAAFLLALFSFMFTQGVNPHIIEGKIKYLKTTSFLGK